MPAPALAKTLKDVFNTANPTPLQSGDPRYVDCTAVRGNEDAVTLLFNAITWSDQPATAPPAVAGLPTVPPAAANPPSCSAWRSGWRMPAMP
jgi:hypothetical protein